MLLQRSPTLIQTTKLSKHRSRIQAAVRTLKNTNTTMITKL
jgi:hypothetical protein